MCLRKVMCLLLVATVVFFAPVNGTDSSFSRGQRVESFPNHVLSQTTVQTEIELPPGNNYYIFFNATTQAFEKLQIDPTAGLSQVCKDAIAKTPDWLKHNLTRAFKKLGFSADRYANLILSEPDSKYIDEIAFVIAHTSIELLSTHRFPEVIVENAHSIYKNDLNISYADVRDINGPNGAYSTIVYKVNESGVIRTYTLPPNIYYWYVVHPKCSDDRMTYIDPAQYRAEAAPPAGKFWRDYLFNHNDSTYLNYGDGATVKFPKDAPPPLLSEKLQGVETLWNCTNYEAPPGYEDTGYNNRRPWNYGDFAIEKVSNWVEKTLPLNVMDHPEPYQPGSSQPERATEPIRIAYLHRGNCGELQDLSTAGGRSALIPVRSVHDFAEDHVWQEFYHLGWHQWDNWWSDSGTAVDRPWIYKHNWGKIIPAIFSWKGNDYCGEQTLLYSPTATLKIKVEDVNGKPVDGAQVLLATKSDGGNYGIDNIAMWNHTDASGITEFKVGNGIIDYFARVDTESLGGYPTNIRNRIWVMHNPSVGAESTYTFRLSQASPARKPVFIERQYAIPPTRAFCAEIDYKIVYTTTYSFNWFYRVFGVWRHYFELNKPSGIDFFICNETNFRLYLNGNQFETYFNSDGIENFLWFPFSYDENWYFVFSNEDSLYTYKTLNLTAKLYKWNVKFYGKHLQKGWNLVSIPFGYSDQSIESMLQSIKNKYDALQCYDAVSGKWFAYSSVKPAYLNTFKSITPEIGFWLHVKENCTLVLPEGGMAERVITFRKGWNLIGYPSFTERNLSDFFTTQITAVVKVQKWSSTGKYNLEIMNASEKMQPWNAYWVLVNKQFELRIS